MLLNQINALDDISIELKKVNSLLTLLNDYFQKANPEAYELQTRYEVYQDLVGVVGDIIFIQKRCIDNASEKLLSIRNELKRVGELV